MSNVQDAHESASQFEKAALAAFSFLRHTYGFTVTESHANLVRFESIKVVVEISYDTNSCELSADIWRKQSPYANLGREVFTVWEVARLAEAPDISERAFVQAVNTREVAKFLPELSRVLATYGQHAIEGDEQTFLMLRHQQQRESDRFVAAGRSGYLRPKIEQAWHEKDYEEVVKLMMQLPGALSVSDQAKLEYAQKYRRTN